jgi:hypothetical protein
MTELELDPALLATLRTLERHDVGFILVGGVAQAIHDLGGFVCAVAIVPEPYARNVERLRDALRALDAQLDASQITGAGSTLDYGRADLRELAPCRFLTGEADVDVTFEPGGTGGYQDLFDDAARVRLAPGVAPLVASREDLERIARATQPPPYAQPPAALPPEPALGSGWPEAEIRVSRVSRA